MTAALPDDPRRALLARLCAALTAAKKQRRKLDRAAQQPAERARRAALSRAEQRFNREVNRAREMFSAEVAAAARRLERARKEHA